MSIWFWTAYLVSSQTPATRSAVSAATWPQTLRDGLPNLAQTSLVRPDRDRIGGDFPVEVDGRTHDEGRGDAYFALSDRQQLARP